MVSPSPQKTHNLHISYFDLPDLIEVIFYRWQIFTGVLLLFLGNQNLRVVDCATPPPTHPSILETLPDDYPDLKQELAKLESQLFDRPKRKATEPLTPVIAEANDRWE